MTQELTELFRDPRKKRKGRIKRSFYTFLACLGISVFLWSLVRLSKDYVYTVHYKLVYTGIPEYLKFSKVPDSILTINIRVQGFDFFSEEYFRMHERTFEVSLKGIKVRNGGDNHPTGFLLSRNIALEIARQTNYPLEIYTATPDTLFFLFERKYPRKTSSLEPGNAMRDLPVTDTLSPAEDSSGMQSSGASAHEPRVKPSLQTKR